MQMSYSVTGTLSNSGDVGKKNGETRLNDVWKCRLRGQQYVKKTWFQGLNNLMYNFQAF